MTRNFRLGLGARSRQGVTDPSRLVPGFGLPAGFGLGHGFSLDPGRVFTAGVPFGSLRGDALCGTFDGLDVRLELVPRFGCRPGSSMGCGWGS